MLYFKIEPNKTNKWEELILNYPPFTISLDGHTKGPPAYDKDIPMLNLNHHEEVNDLSTKCTSSQAYSHIMNGLFEDKFVKDGEPYAHIFANDPDQDVCLAYYLLMNNKKLFSTKINHMLDRLVHAEDNLDCTAGAYPYDLSSNVMRDIAWVFDPYTSVRVKKDIQSLNEKEMMEIILSVYERIDEHVKGKGKKIKPNPDYDEIERGDKWIMFREVGPFARTKLFTEGMRFFVVLMNREDGKYSYKVTTTQYYDGNLHELYKTCNEIEGILPDAKERWSGGGLRGGSPRGVGTAIPPKGMIKIIKEVIEKR